MRKLMALAIVLVLAGATRSWALFGLGDISYDGSLEVSGNSANNEVDQSDQNDHRGNTATRTRLGLNAQVTEGVKARLEFVRNPEATGSALYGAQSPTNPNSAEDETDNFNVHNAYVELDDLWHMQVRLGRQYVGNSGDLVWHIGPKSDDSLTVSSIDGLALQCKEDKQMGNFFDKLHLTLFTGKSNEDDGVANTDDDDGAGDINLSAADLTIKDVLPNGKINLGFLWGKDSNAVASTNDESLTIMRVGLRGGLMENMLTYRAEYFQNGGQLEAGATETKYEGNAIDAGVGFNSAETSAGMFGLWLNWAQASGDSDNADSDDEAFHDFSSLGLNTSDRYYGEIFGKSNTLATSVTTGGQGLDSGFEGQGLSVLNIGAQWKPKFVEKTTAKVDYFTFSTSEDGVAAQSTLDKFGTEIDLSVAYDHSDNVNLTFGYAMLSPDDAITGGAGAQDEDITKLFARATIKWGGAAAQ